MALYDTLILVVALAMILIGLQTMLEPERREVPTEVIKSTFMVITGLYFLYFWYSEVSLGTNGNMKMSY
jgi:hypothetical protein